MYYFLAFITGIFVIITIIFNGNLNRTVGYKQTTLINFIFGLLFAIILLLIMGFKIDTSLINVPMYLYLGGMIGVSVVIISSTIVIRISAVYTTILVFIGQMVTGIIIDLITLGTADIGNIVGSILIIIGLSINSYFDRKELA